MIAIKVLNAQPWRFIPGDLVHVRGWHPEEPAEVLAQITSRRWPHYLVRDVAGATWRVSQLELSSKPIPYEKPQA